MIWTLFRLSGNFPDHSDPFLDHLDGGAGLLTFGRMFSNACQCGLLDKIWRGDFYKGASLNGTVAWFPQQYSPVCRSLLERKTSHLEYLCVHVFAFASLMCICVFAIVFALLLAGRMQKMGLQVAPLVRHTNGPVTCSSEARRTEVLGYNKCNCPASDATG